ncbi:diguanylate cyclase [Halomonas sp. 141]|uniref:diguanylate cyclase n=1 Tax=Halomonas sp. 141 TaxID=2056666 RepID=UPI0012FE2C0F|nr:GGDEF domain-containing protein [Halomonas sp. 141]
MLLFIALDDFKPVNDRFGHGVGDQLLQAVAQRLRQRLHGGDRVGRIGGDEFVAMLGGPVGAEEALLPLHAAEESTLIHCADQAMYQAKAQGRNQAVLYAPVSPGAS